MISLYQYILDCRVKRTDKLRQKSRRIQYFKAQMCIRFDMILIIEAI